MSDRRQKALIKECVDLGVPVDDAFALAPLIEEWFDAAAEDNTDAGYSVATYDTLPDLILRISKWSRLD